MSAARILKFVRRFKSGALCEVEIDLEAVRDNSFTPHFRWRGRTHKAREFICWARSVFGIVADRQGFRSCGASSIGETGQLKLGFSRRVRNRDG